MLVLHNEMFMKRINPLTKEDEQILPDATRYAPESRFRQRTHAVYLSAKGYRVNQLADIFSVDRETVVFGTTGAYKTS